MKRVIFVLAVAALAGFIAFSAPAAVQQTDELKKFANYEELKNFVKASAEDYNTYSSLGAPTLAARSTESLGAPASTDSSKDFSSTNVQVAGVDEADIIKNDGKYIYTISGGIVAIVDALPAGNMSIVSEINLSGSQLHGLFVNGDRLVVFGNENVYRILGAEKPEALIYPPSSAGTFVNIYDISDRVAPKLLSNVSAEGYYTNSRMIGDYAYMIINQPISTSRTAATTS